MRFDDRLLTVLNQPVSDRHDMAVRWRQLVELVARAGPNSASPVVTRALDAIRSEAPNVDEPLRAAAARAVAALPLPLGLLESFAADKLAVSAPVLAAATLQSIQWRALLEVADDETRRFVETLHPEIVPAPEPAFASSAEAPMPEPIVMAPATMDNPAAVAPPEPLGLIPGKSLSEVVARIERRRRIREPQALAALAAADGSPSGDPTLFRWECQPSGEIAWVDGVPRGALIGRSIARSEGTGGIGVDESVVRAFAIRSPFRDASLIVPGEGAVAGQWKVSGVPAFDPSDGRFAGYRGVAMREITRPLVPAMASDVLTDPDSLRELVHEIKTPLNAIIGFAEIIDGQLLGPADRRYRERAADIVRQARLLLGAIDDLDFAAQLHSSSGNGGSRSDLGVQVEGLAASLNELAATRGAVIDISRTMAASTCRVAPELLDRLLYRLCATVIEQARAGEHLRLEVDSSRASCLFTITRPESLASVTERQMFEASSTGEDPEIPVGFMLRLVRGLARIAGGDLIVSGPGLTLSLPSA